MAVVAIDHIQVAMPAGGERKAVAFYQDILGIPEAPNSPLVANRGGCWFISGSLKVHLGVDPDFRPSQKAHPGFLVENLPAVRRALSANGYAVEPDEPLPGYLRLYVSDPFGNRIELLEPAGAASRRG